MLTFQRCLRRAALLALALLIVSAPAGADARLGSCGRQPVSQVFLRWADPAWYASVPEGGLEAGGLGWTLGAGAAVVSGNEPYYVRSATDTRALALAPGASAATPPTCIGPGYPTLRFFVRSALPAQSTLTVTVDLVDPTGAVRSVPIGMLAPTPSWQPSPVLLVVSNVVSLLVPQQAVFHFTASGTGAWWVDDVYVDPYGKG